MKSFKKEVNLFMIFDILGDIERSGPHMWQIERFRLEDVKNHILDLLLIARILKQHFPNIINYNKITDYIICHDLPEALTGDITKFEGISDEEKQRVTKIAINYLSETFKDVLDLETILNNYETRSDLESKIVHMIDKVHSSTTFIKYEAENHIDYDNPNIIPILRQLPFVATRINEGKDVADIFYEYHIRSVEITDEECKKYNISKEEADQIVRTIKAFAEEFYNQKLTNTLFKQQQEFPKEAMQYNKTKKES